MDFTLLIALFEFVGALTIVYYAALSLFTLLRRHDIVSARLLMLDGVLAGLTIKLAATFLKTIELHTWTQIGLFVSVFAMRTLLKQLFTWEKSKLRIK